MSDVDATDLKPSLWINTGKVRLSFSAVGSHASVGGMVNIDFAVDGVRVAAAGAGLGGGAGQDRTNLGAHAIVEGIAVGTHTFAVQASAAATGTIFANGGGGDQIVSFSVEELDA
jgi:hypothetical protein